MHQRGENHQFPFKMKHADSNLVYKLLPSQLDLHNTSLTLVPTRVGSHLISSQRDFSTTHPHTLKPSIMAKDDPYEPKVRFFSPMPAGYVFVAKGDVFVTKNCRKKTHDAGKTLYVVIDKAKKVLGLRCPAQIHEAVEAENKATAGRRADAVQKRDTIVEGQFEQDILRLYPKTPEDEIPKIIKHSLAKRSGRVSVFIPFTANITSVTDREIGG